VSSVPQPTSGLVEVSLTSRKAVISRIAMAPYNSSLQRTGTHKVLGRGRPSVVVLCGRWRARVLEGQWPAAELGS
jgi:hypothetical protein